MKIVSWNCRKGLYKHDKYKKIQELDADIYVILEVNKPKVVDAEYEEFMNNSRVLLYDDESDKAHNYGIAIIAKEGIILKENHWHNVNNSFLSVNVDDSLDIIGVWTHSPNYLKDLNNYLEENKDYIDNSDKLIMCGDFNLDLGIKNMKNKTSFAETLKEHGYESIYHKLNNEKIGEESQKTYFTENKGEIKEYFDDYLFASPDIITSFDLGSRKKYVDCGEDYSDHVPLIFEVDL